MKMRNTKLRLLVRYLELVTAVAVHQQPYSCGHTQNQREGRSVDPLIDLRWQSAAWLRLLSWRRGRLRYEACEHTLHCL